MEHSFNVLRARLFDTPQPTDQRDIEQLRKELSDLRERLNEICSILEEVVFQILQARSLLLPLLRQGENRIERRSYRTRGSERSYTRFPSRHGVPSHSAYGRGVLDEL